MTYMEGRRNMDRDQRKDLENEQTPQEDDIDIRPDDGPVDDMRYYLSLLKAIRQTINGGKGFRLSLIHI